MNNPKDTSQDSNSEAPGTLHQAINRSMAKGAAWMVAMRLVIRFIGLISTVILARLLFPADFGLVAIATMVAALIDTISHFSFDVVLIQKQNTERDYYDTAWTLSIIRGLVTALILFAGAGIAADFFNDQRLVEIIYVLCLVAFINGLANIGIVDFRKDMTFGKDFRFMVYVKLISFIVTIVMAVILRSYWALVVGIASNAFAQLALSYSMHPFRPRWSLARWREIFDFSKWLVLENILTFTLTRSDQFIVGKIFGAATLGIYSIAYEIATLATTELVAPIRRALFPGYAKLAYDQAALRKSFVEGFALIVMIGAPVAIGIGLVADPTVRLLLGPKWLGAIPMLQLLAIFGLIQILTSNVGPLLLALGRPKLVMIISLIKVATTLPIYVGVALYWGVSGLLWSKILLNLFFMLITLSITAQVINLSLWAIVGATWRSFTALIAMAVAVALLASAITSKLAPNLLAFELGLEILVGIVSFVGVHLFLWRLCRCPNAPEQQAINLARMSVGHIKKFIAA